MNRDSEAESLAQLHDQYNSMMKLAQSFLVAANKQDPQSDRRIFFMHCAHRVEQEANQLCISASELGFDS